MITPFGQRQIFQTAGAEAVRQAHEVVELLQREAAKQKAADERRAQETDAVHQVPGSDRIRTDERREKRSRQEGSGGEQPPGEEAQASEPEGDAGNADPHLDFLA